MTYDHSDIRLYINGSLVSSTSYSEDIEVNNNPWLFGEKFYGVLDEIALYDKSLSPEIIQQHYQLFKFT